MLAHLHIENIAVIEKTGLDLSSGLNVLTGETGAGKSILIDAIGAAMGGRASKELVRTGCESAAVSALFTDIGETAKKALAECGFEPEEDGSLLIQRTLGADGKGACRINGRPATVSLLRTVCAPLLTIHGQHDSQSLLNADGHYQYLDRLGDYQGILDAYARTYRELRASERQLRDTDTDDSRRAQRVDMLAFQADELEKAELHEGEMDELAARRLFLQNVEAIAQALGSAHARIAGDEDASGALALTQSAASALAGVQDYLAGTAELTARLESVGYELDDIAAELRGGLERAEYDPAELERIEERLHLLTRLARKYGGDEEHMLAYLQKIREEMETLDLGGERLEVLKARCDALRKQATERAASLTAARREAGKRFEKRVCEELGFLDMPGVRFAVRLSPCEMRETGADDIEFLISVNPGEPSKPLAKIASGGELSRIMLAIKSVLADKDDVDTLIFDEIDTGISGRAAQKVGVKLRQTARGRQILCITHLAQIAALADEHLLIEKLVRSGRTYTEVAALDFDGRKAELARIIGGVRITDATLKSAEEMLRQVSELT